MNLGIRAVAITMALLCQAAVVFNFTASQEEFVTLMTNRHQATDNNTSSPPQQHGQNLDFMAYEKVAPKLIIRMGGEMANNLGFYAQGYALHLLIQQKFNITTQIVIQHQTKGSKWKIGERALKRCFPSFRSLNFSEGNTVALIDAYDNQPKVLDTMGVYMSRLADPDNETRVVETIKRFLEIYYSQPATNETSNVFRPNLIPSGSMVTDGNIMMNEFYRQIKAFFIFNSTECCTEKPDPDESVFHLRDFLTEMPRKGKHAPYLELSPNRTAYDLFGHLKRGDKIAITSRFNNNRTLSYGEALSNRGLRVRHYTSKDESGLLGNAKKVRAYSVNWAATQQWIHPDLKHFSVEDYEEPKK